ncbi:MAG: nuclear transport factor 2 family protein [Pseudomonadota bacterium]
MSASEQARAIADAQLIAYNAQDMDAYLALFHDDAVLVNLPAQDVIAEGLAAIRDMYEVRFSTPGLYCEVTHRAELGPVAIDHETVYTDGNPPLNVLAMYEVVDHKIKRIFFVRGGDIPTPLSALSKETDV